MVMGCLFLACLAVAAAQKNGGSKGGGTGGGGTGGTGGGSTDGHGSIYDGGGTCHTTVSDTCSTSGADAAYSETISGESRVLSTSGCPNSNPLTNCLGEEVSLHARCGQTKALWMIATAGWC